MPTLNGADYVVVVPDSPRGQRLGQSFKISTRDGVVVRVGETCERVPAKSLPWLLEAGYIRRVDAEATSGNGTPAERSLLSGEPAEGALDAVAERAGPPRLAPRRRNRR